MAKEKATETAEELVTVFVDPKRTRGGIWVNGKRYVGKVRVPADMADDLIRIQEDHGAVLDKMNDPSVILRHQSLSVIRNKFIADPSVQGHHPDFTKEYGLLDSPKGAAAIHLKYVSQKDIDEWKQEREGLYGY